MASSNTDSPATIYRWIEKKPLTEAVSWTSKEKFWLVIAIYHYGTHDWKKVAQVARHVGESYRPQEWFSPTNCERQFKILVSNLSKEVKSLPFNDMMQHIAEGLKSDYKREINKSRDALKTKYCSLFNILNRVKQGNLSRSEIVNLYSQARRFKLNEIEGKQYMEQLMTRQNASLASENSSSGLIEEPIKWNTPSAPLLTSLLRSRNTIPANRTATTITSLLQSPGGTSRTRSGKLLPLTPSIRTTQGTPTLSKLLEAPANPYIPNPLQATQKNKLTEVVAEKLVNTSRKENSHSTSLNKVRVDNMTTLGSFNQINKSDLSTSKKQISKSPVSVVKSGSKANLSAVTLLSDSENDEDKNISLKSLFGDKKDTGNRVEPRATRSQTRAEGGFKQINDTKLSDGKKDREKSGGSLINEQHSIDDVMADIDQIEVQPLSSIQDEIQSQTPSKMTRSSLQKLRLSVSGDNLLTNNKVNTKDISNKMIEEISSNFVLNSSPKSIPPQYQCLLTKPRNNNSNTSECLIPIDRIAVKDAIMIRKDSQSLQNTLNTSDGKQEGVIEINASNVTDSRNDSKVLSLNNQPVLVVNKIKKPFNIKLTSEQKNDDIQVTNTDLKKPMQLNYSSQNVVKLTDKNCTATAAANDDDDDDDDIIILDDENYIDDNNKTLIKTKELSSNIESQNVSSIVVSPNISSNSKSTVLQLDEKKNKNDKTPWNMFGKPQNILDSTKTHCHQDNVSKNRINSNISETNNQFIKELDFDFDQSISQTSLAELYNGVEEIVEMHSFDNEELNSLIECGSLDSNETEEHRNTVSVDQGDSSVSESDSTIGAFDTFAQITRVRPRSSTPKDIKLDTKELKITNQGIKHFKESFCQSDKIENNQSSVLSVTGIPILQGVISDVMNQIDLDSVASLTTSNSHNLPSNDVVELISSDEEGSVKNLKAHPLNIQNKKIQIQDKEKEGKSFKLKEVELIKLHDTEAKALKDNNINCGISNIQPIQIEMPSCIIIKSPISDTEKLTVNQILEIKKEATQDNEMVYYSNPDEIIDINEFDDDEIEPKGIAVKIANAKLLKETERMRKEAKENEDRMKNEQERKRKEDERLKKEEDERRKKENDDRMKKENEEKKKIEELRAFEKMLINERKKVEREEDCRKKEEYQRKMNDLHRSIKIELKQKKEGKTLKEIYEKERYKRDSLSEYDSTMKNEFKFETENSVEVKEGEIINKCVVLEEIAVKDCFIEDTYLGEIKARKDTPKVNLKPKNVLKCPTELDRKRGIELQSKEESSKRLIELKECKRLEDLMNKNKISLVSDVPGQNEYNRMTIPIKTNQLEIKTKEVKEDEKQRAIEVKLQRLKEAEIQKVKEAEKQRANEIISRGAKEAEIKIVKAAELERIKNERIKRAEEVETKKSKEAELRKNITVKETEIKGLEKRNVLKKVNETGNNRSVGHTEVKLVKNTFKKKNEDFQNETKIEQLYIETSKVSMEHKKPLIETRKVTSKEDVETFNPRERGIRKCIGLDGKNTKVIEPKSSDVKMVTRTRGLKIEEKMKELDNIKIASCTKVRPQLILNRYSPPPSKASSNSVENSSISSHEYKKQTKNTDDGNKRISTSNIPNDKRHDRDLNVGSRVSVKKDNFNHEAFSTPRTRTRSSSFKQKTISETKSSKQSQDNGAAIISKETIKKKTTSTLKRQELAKHFFNTGGLIPVVLLDKRDVNTQRSIDLFKQQQNKPVLNQVQKPAETNIQLPKPPPKKRGRKRRIDIQNEKLQETPRSSKQTPKNCGKTRILEKEVEPLAKRTRRSLGLRNIKQESMSKQSVQPRKFKKQHVNKAIESIKTKKKVLQFVFNNLCEKSKYILSLDKKIKNLPTKCLDIVKFPIKLKEIKKKITTGKIKNINELQFNLVMWSYNAQMIKRSDNIVFNEVSNFQYELEEYCRSLKNAVNDQNVDKYQKENNLFYIHGDDRLNLRYSGAKKVPNDARITVNKKTIANIYKYIDNSCDESSGSESDSYMPPKKKRKKNISDFSNSESD